MRSVALVALWVHLLGMAVWLGGLMYQAHVLMPMARRSGGPTGAAAFAEAARRQRPIGWAALALVVLSGLYNVTQLGPIDRVMQSGAGLLLAGKFIFVLLLIMIAAQRDFTHLVRLHLALTTNEDPAPALRSLVLLDRVTILLAAVIIYLGLAVSRS
jgi:copper resistance protein D